MKAAQNSVFNWRGLPTACGHFQPSAPTSALHGRRLVSGITGMVEA